MADPDPSDPDPSDVVDDDPSEPDPSDVVDGSPRDPIPGGVADPDRDAEFHFEGSFEPDPDVAFDRVVDPDVDLDDPSCYLNRELSELAFHRRVLHEAVDDRTPLLDRVRFLSIVTSNLDEFFMKRVGGLKQQLAASVTGETPDGLTPHEQLVAATETARDLFAAQEACFHEDLRPALADAGIVIAEYADLTDEQRARLRSYFERSVLPTLTPLTVDPSRPFPFISNLSLSLAVLTRDEDGDEKFSRVKLPGNRPRLLRVADPAASDDDHPAGRDEPVRFVPLAGVVAANLDLLFPNVQVVDASTFRVTRNAEVGRDPDVAEGLISTIEGVLRQRRFATVVRLEVASDIPDRARDRLVENLELEQRAVFEREPPLDFGDLSAVAALDRPDLRAPAWTPQPHPRLDGTDHSLFTELRRGDLLVHHPYQSFDETVQRFLDEAATDPDVLAIKVAIYRTGQHSEVVESLIRAARNGKQVAVMVELTARFDEANNLRWVRRLEEEGIHVAYGTTGLKAHSKVALVVREEDDGVELYSHVGTGNYHAGTARQYVDLGLLTAEGAVGRDLTRVFNFFTGHGFPDEYGKLLVAPRNLRAQFVEHVRREAAHAREGRDARIVAKMNALEDPAMVRELYAASQAGVDVDLLVRGICRLRPGVEGLSDSVDVYSVVGRFLEHSRVFYFEHGHTDPDAFGADGDLDASADAEPAFYIGSADWMTRNLDRRVEVVAPITDPALREELWTVLETYLADNRQSWVLQPDGTYEQRQPGPDEPVRSAQETLMRRARAAGEPDASD